MARGKAFWRDRHGVTPVLGSILVLGITVLGVAAVLMWGAPTIQRIQDRNAQMGMTGEFEDLRLSGLALSVPDASRTPTIVLQNGELDLRPGTRSMVTANHDNQYALAYPDCDFHVTGWHDSDATVTVSTDSCRGDTGTIHVTGDCTGLLPTQDKACLEIWKVSGNNLVKQEVTSGVGSTYEVTGEDFSTGHWLFRLTDGEADAEVYAQAWLFSSDMHVWNLESPLGERLVYHDGSAVFSQVGEQVYLESELPLQEDAFGSGDFVLWLRSFSAISEASVTGPRSTTVFMGLVGSYTRIDEDAVDRLRFDFEGTLSGPWCQAYLARNNDIDTGEYTLDIGTSCDDDVPSLLYTPDSGTVPVEFLHANIRTSLVV